MTGSQAECATKVPTSRKPAAIGPIDITFGDLSIVLRGESCSSRWASSYNRGYHIPENIRHGKPIACVRCLIRKNLPGAVEQD